MENTEQQTLQAEFDTPPEPLAQPDTTPNHQCPKCQRVFTSAPALRMHHVRKHSGRGWNTAGNFKKRKPTKGTTGMKLGQWSQERREQFKRTWAKKKAAATSNHSTPGTREINPPGVMFCPRCGCNIKIVAAALSFGDKHQ